MAKHVGSAMVHSLSKMTNMVALDADRPLSTKFSNEEAESAWNEEARRVEERLTLGRDHDGSRFILTSANPFRIAWSLLIGALLVYTGTIFVYRLAFIEFRIERVWNDDESSVVVGQRSSEVEALAGWYEIDQIVTIIFIVDLVLNFFFSYVDEVGQEVVGLKPVARRYLSTTFAIDLVACVPDELITAIAREAGQYGTVSQSVKSLRLKRLSRLFRLTSLARLLKLVPFYRSAVTRWFRRQKGLLVINLGGSLLWLAHILACGWYICAALHEDPENTWVGRRVTDSETGLSLIDRDPIDNWLQAMYFTLTVFTTVGFGDISAMSNGEIGYCCVMMAFGAVMNSIVVTSVIRIVTTHDQSKLFVQQRTDLMDAFAEHTGIPEDSRRQLKSWVKLSARFWIAHEYDRREMRELIAGKYMPSSLANSLPYELFEGRLIINRIFSVCGTVCRMPPRLPMLLGLAGTRMHFSYREIVYTAQDYAGCIYLVLTGTFAYVDVVGGRTEMQPIHSTISRGGMGGKRTGSTSNFPTEEARSKQGDFEEPQFPFQLFSCGAYFGDVELFGKHTRQCSVRCETSTGSLLSVTKADIRQLAEDFPSFGSRWHLEAKRRKSHFQRVGILRHCWDYETLAAATIQRWWHSQAQERRNRRLWNRTSTVIARPSISELLVPTSFGTKQGTMQVIKKDQEGMRRDLTALTTNVAALQRSMVALMEAFHVQAPPSVESGGAESSSICQCCGQLSSGPSRSRSHSPPSSPKLPGNNNNNKSKATFAGSGSEEEEDEEEALAARGRQQHHHHHSSSNGGGGIIGSNSGGGGGGGGGRSMSAARAAASQLTSTPHPPYPPPPQLRAGTRTSTWSLDEEEGESGLSALAPAPPNAFAAATSSKWKGLVRFSGVQESDAHFTSEPAPSTPNGKSKHVPLDPDDGCAAAATGERPPISPLWKL